MRTRFASHRDIPARSPPPQWWAYLISGVLCFVLFVALPIVTNTDFKYWLFGALGIGLLWLVRRRIKLGFWD